jgi:hypothetical protein
LIHPNIVGHAVPKPLPVAFIAFLDDRRMVRANVGIQKHRGANAMFIQHLHHAKHTDARAVIAQRVARDVGQLGAGRARNHFVDMKEFNIGRDHQGDARVVRPGKRLAPDDRPVIVTIGLHPKAPFGGARRG